MEEQNKKIDDLINEVLSSGVGANAFATEFLHRFNIHLCNSAHGKLCAYDNEQPGQIARANAMSERYGIADIPPSIRESVELRSGLPIRDAIFATFFPVRPDAPDVYYGFANINSLPVFDANGFRFLINRFNANGWITDSAYSEFRASSNLFPSIS